MRRRKEVESIDGAIYRANRNRKKYGNKEPFLMSFHEPRIGFETLSQELSAANPYIVDISGFSNGLRNIARENSQKGQEINNVDDWIADLFGLHSSKTQCLILNGCYVERQARKISRRIKFVLGISQKNA